jgi:beta-xylosidase
MTRNRILNLICIPLLIVGFNISAQSDSESNDTYVNPIGDTIYTADPSIVFHDGTYYLYGTSASDGFLCWSSQNLVDWRALGYAYKRTENSWGKNSFWAPEVVFYNNKFYMVFSCNGGDQDNLKLRLCLAVSDKPEGPFHDLKVPYFDNNYSCIDGHIFNDDDGISYLFYEWVGVVGKPWNREGYFWGMIFGVQLNEDLSLPDEAEHKLCLYVDESWEGSKSMHARSCEGMTIIKNNGLYYMTYSCNHYADPNYGIGYATAKTPLGMWTKSQDNPILSRNIELGVSGPGHNCITKSPDGREMFIVYHSHADPQKPSGRRLLNIDRIIFEESGNLKIIGPTRTPQPLPSGSVLEYLGK